MYPMRIRRLLTLTTVVVLQVPVAWAQVPAHQPGTICNTPQGWCWANPSGVPGTSCVCPVDGGTAQGILG